MLEGAGSVVQLVRTLVRKTRDAGSRPARPTGLPSKALPARSYIQYEHFGLHRDRKIKLRDLVARLNFKNNCRDWIGRVNFTNKISEIPRGIAEFLIFEA